MTNPITREHRLSVARAWEGDELAAVPVQTWVATGALESRGIPSVRNRLEALERLAQLMADAEPKPIEGGALVMALTEVMREADRKFEKVGGSTRHHVRDCLIPELEAAGLAVVRLPKPPEQP
jgi:hypothetical protein